MCEMTLSKHTATDDPSTLANVLRAPGIPASHSKPSLYNHIFAAFQKTTASGDHIYMANSFAAGKEYLIFTVHKIFEDTALCLEVVDAGQPTSLEIWGRVGAVKEKTATHVMTTFSVYAIKRKGTMVIRPANITKYGLAESVATEISVCFPHGIFDMSE